MNDHNVLVLGSDTEVVNLPTPRVQGGRPLLEVFAARRSSREFSAEPLPLTVLSELLWCACGVNRKETQCRTAPSARNWQEIEIIAVMRAGAFVYEPRLHRLSRLVGDDLRAQTGTQDFVATAPLNLVYVADLEKLGALDPQERRFYCAADAAFIAENVYLYCASEGLATVVRGLVDRPALAKALGLRAQQRVILAQSVGYPGGPS